MKTLNINCKKAAEYMCRKEEHKLSFWEKLQLSWHLVICGLCRSFQQQDEWLRNNVNKVDEHCKGCLSEADKQAILEKLR